MTSPKTNCFAVFFEDDTGEFSMGRLIAFSGSVVLTPLIIATGLILAVIETLNHLTTGNGIALVGIGTGIYTGGAWLKGWSKASEAAAMSGVGQTQATSVADSNRLINNNSVNLQMPITGEGR